jgi:hypothetical protein
MIHYMKKNEDKIRSTYIIAPTSVKISCVIHFDPLVEKTKGIVCVCLGDESQLGFLVRGTVVRRRVPTMPANTNLLL